MGDSGPKLGLLILQFAPESKVAQIEESLL